MPPGIVAATTAEARILSGKAIAPDEFIQLPGGAILLCSGIGPHRARLGARALVEKGATALVSWGTAGGLLAGLSPGSLILPGRIIASDHSAYPVDPVWHERLCSRLKGHFSFYNEDMTESGTVLATRLEKETLWRRTGAIATDMESASIAWFAQEAGVPLAVIRAVADPAEMPIGPSLLQSIDEFGRVRFSRLVRSLIRNPMEILTLLRLGRNFRAAQAALVKVVRRAGNQFLYAPAAASIRKGDGIYRKTAAGEDS